jgi:hypothetical protein
VIDIITFIITLGYHHHYFQSVGLNNDIQSILRLLIIGMMRTVLIAMLAITEGLSKIGVFGCLGVWGVHLKFECTQ